MRNPKFGHALVALIAIASLGIIEVGFTQLVTAGPVVQVQYVGIHPIPKSAGGGICYIEGPHVHIYQADKLQYRDHGGANYFVGDPMAYGYEGRHYAYKGPHPIHVDAVVGDGVPDDEYCYIDGPHFHYFAPPEGPDFKLVGDAYFFVGEPPHVYVEARPQMAKINAVYQPLVYDRPSVTVDAPIGWIGARPEFVAPVAAVVVAPSGGVTVGVGVPAPSVHVGIGLGIGAGIGIGIGRPAVIVRERPVIIHERPVIIEERVKVKHHGHW